MTISCKKTSSNFEFGINVTFHVLILFTFLTVFFLLFISKLAKSSFENQIGDLIDSNFDKAFYNLDESSKRKLYMILDKSQLDKLREKYNQPSDYVKEHNKWITISAIAISVVGVLGLIMILYLIYNSCGKCVPLTHIITENIITFIFIGLVEYLFFVNVAFKFVPASPSLLTNSLINKFKSSLIDYS